MSSHELLRPVWKMECERCTFLGGHITENGERLDFYFHKAKQFTGGGVLFVRWSNDENAEDTSPIDLAKGEFVLARRMAQELGLVDSDALTSLRALGHWRGQPEVYADPEDNRGLYVTP